MEYMPESNVRAAINMAFSKGLQKTARAAIARPV
jgi:hypothetical protein